MEMSLSNPLMISFFVVFFSLFILTLFIAKKSDTRKLSRILFTKKNINRDLINLVVNGIKIQPPDKELSFEKMSSAIPSRISFYLLLRKLNLSNSITRTEMFNSNDC